MILIFQLSTSLVLLRVDEVTRELGIMNDTTKKKFLDFKLYLEKTGLLKKRDKLSDYYRMVEKIKSYKYLDEVYDYLIVEMHKLGCVYKKRMVDAELYKKLG